MTIERTASKQRGRPFPKGRSGNPQGRPLGARNAATVLAEQLIDGEAEALIRKLLEKAKKGDITALRLCIDRILPPRRERPILFSLPDIETAADVVTALGVVVTSLASGDLTPEQATAVANVIEVKRKAIETAELEARMRAIEERIEVREQST